MGSGSDSINAWTAPTSMLVGFALALALLLAAAVYGFLEHRAARSGMKQAMEAVTVTRRLESSIAFTDSRHRAFIAGGDPAFLRLRDVDQAEGEAALRELADLWPDDPQRLGALDQLKTAFARHSDAMRETIAVAERGGMDAARNHFRDVGSAAMTPIRDAIAVIRSEEEDRLAQRIAQSDRIAARLDAALLAGTALAVLLLAAGGNVLLRQLRRVEDIRRTLAHTNALQHAMLDGGGLMIIAVRPDGVIRFFNRAASQALGYAAEEMVGRHTPAVFHDENEIVARAAQLSQDMGVPIAPGFGVFTARPDRGLADHAEWTYVRKDGSRFPVDLSVTAVRGPDGESLGYVGMALDLTRHRSDEAAIHALNTELREQARSLALANQELESFSYSVSHDLRAPLRHIDGYARMLREDAGDRLDAECRRYLDNIALSARRMGALIDDLLAFSRFGRAQMQHQRVDMQALAEDALREVGARPGTVTIGPMPTALGDPSMLRQVWLNLLSNAVKYSAPRGEDARIEVGGSARDSAATYFVRDNGVGFDMRHRDKLFGVFQRLHPQDDFEGTGVGLAIVRRILSRQDGSIDAVARPDFGATFTFQLPSEAG